MTQIIRVSSSTLGLLVRCGYPIVPRQNIRVSVRIFLWRNPCSLRRVPLCVDDSVTATTSTGLTITIRPVSARWPYRIVLISAFSGMLVVRPAIIVSIVVSCSFTSISGIIYRPASNYFWEISVVYNRPWWFFLAPVGDRFPAVSVGVSSGFPLLDRYLIVLHTVYVIIIHCVTWPMLGDAWIIISSSCRWLVSRCHKLRFRAIKPLPLCRVLIHSVHCWRWNASLCTTP